MYNWNMKLSAHPSPFRKFKFMAILSTSVIQLCYSNSWRQLWLMTLVLWMACKLHLTWAIAHIYAYDSHEEEYHLIIIFFYCTEVSCNWKNSDQIAWIVWINLDNRMMNIAAYIIFSRSTRLCKYIIYTDDHILLQPCALWCSSY